MSAAVSTLPTWKDIPDIRPYEEPHGPDVWSARPDDDVAQAIVRLPAMARQHDELTKIIRRLESQGYNGPNFNIVRSRLAEAHLKILDANEIVRQGADAAVEAGELVKTGDTTYGMAGLADQIIGVVLLVAAVIVALLPVPGAQFLAITIAIAALLEFARDSLVALGPAISGVLKSSTAPLLIVAVAGVAFLWFKYKARRAHGTS